MWLQIVLEHRPLLRAGGERGPTKSSLEWWGHYFQTKPSWNTRLEINFKFSPPQSNVLLIIKDCLFSRQGRSGWMRHCQTLGCSQSSTCDIQFHWSARSDCQVELWCASLNLLWFEMHEYPWPCRGASTLPWVPRSICRGYHAWPHFQSQRGMGGWRKYKYQSVPFCHVPLPNLEHSYNRRSYLNLPLNRHKWVHMYYKLFNAF